jgi:hypothetical protein
MKVLRTYDIDNSDVDKLYSFLIKTDNIICWISGHTHYSYDFIENNNIADELNELYDKVKDEKNSIYEKFIGNNNDYNIVNSIMRTIYQVRIDVWKKLIEQNK